LGSERHKSTGSSPCHPEYKIISLV